MPATMKELGLDTLNPEDRIALAMELWDSLDDDRPPSRLSPARSAELSRRDAEMDADPSICLTEEQFWAHFEGKR